MLQQFPEIARPPARSGITDIGIVLRPDGSVYQAVQRPPREQEPRGSFDALGDALPRDAGIIRTTLLAAGSEVEGLSLDSTVALHYLVLPEEYDSARSQQIVHAAVLAARPDLLLPLAGNTVNRVTALMTADGRVDRLYSEVRSKGELTQARPPESTAWAPLFAPLGLAPDQLGVFGLTYVYADAEGRAATGSQDRNTWMIVRYAWPRRDGEPVGGFATNARTPAGDDFDAAAALRIVRQFLPHALARPVPEADLAWGPPTPDPGIPALALDRAGNVILATRLPSRYGISPEAVGVLQQQVPAGVRLSRFVGRPVADGDGRSATVLFAWDMQSDTSRRER
jgi:hypothetical protein